MSGLTPPPKVPLSFLAAARRELGIPAIENRVYRDVSLSLDGYTFKNCAFYNCDLQTALGNFTLDRCWLGDCRIYFGGHSPKILKLASLLDDSFLKQHCTVTVAPDGTISIY